MGWLLEAQQAMLSECGYEQRRLGSPHAPPLEEQREAGEHHRRLCAWSSSAGRVTSGKSVIWERMGISSSPLSHLWFGAS